MCVIDLDRCFSPLSASGLVARGSFWGLTVADLVLQQWLHEDGQPQVKGLPIRRIRCIRDPVHVAALIEGLARTLAAVECAGFRLENGRLDNFEIINNDITLSML
jgi:hypothetical protein